MEIIDIFDNDLHIAASQNKVSPLTPVSRHYSDNQSSRAVAVVRASRWRLNVTGHWTLCCGLRTLIVTAAPCLDRAPCAGGFYAGNTQIDNTAGDGDGSV